MCLALYQVVDSRYARTELSYASNRGGQGAELTSISRVLKPRLFGKLLLGRLLAYRILVDDTSKHDRKTSGSLHVCLSLRLTAQRLRTLSAGVKEAIVLIISVGKESMMLVESCVALYVVAVLKGSSTHRSWADKEQVVINDLELEVTDECYVRTTRTCRIGRVLATTMSHSVTVHA